MKTRMKNASDSIKKLTTIITDAKSKSAMLGPGETAEVLDDVVSTLTTVSTELHDMSGDMPEEGADAAPPAPKPKPLGNGNGEGSEDESTDEEVPPKVKEQMAAMADQIKTLVTEATNAKKEKLASEYSSLFTDPKIKEAKAKEILDSTDDLNTLEARVKEAKAIVELTAGNAVRNASRYQQVGRHVQIHQESRALKQKDASMGSGMQPSITQLDYSRL